jgi:hypothetical protein
MRRFFEEQKQLQILRLVLALLVLAQDDSPFLIAQDDIRFLPA